MKIQTHTITNDSFASTRLWCWIKPRDMHQHQHKSTASTGKKPMRKRFNFQRSGWLCAVSYKCEILMIVKQHLRNCFHLFLLSVRASTVEYLEEVRGLSPHTSVDVSLKREKNTPMRVETPTIPRLDINFIAVFFTLTNLFHLAIQKAERLNDKYANWEAHYKAITITHYKLKGCVRRFWGGSHLGALYVVVQIVPEGVDEVDGVVSGVGVGVSRKQHCWEMIAVFLF